MEGAERQRSFQDRLGEPLRDPLPRRIVRVLNRRPVPRSAPEVAEPAPVKKPRARKKKVVKPAAT